MTAGNAEMVRSFTSIAEYYRSSAILLYFRLIVNVRHIELNEESNETGSTSVTSKLRSVLTKCTRRREHLCLFDNHDRQNQKANRWQDCLGSS